MEVACEDVRVLVSLLLLCAVAVVWEDSDDVVTLVK